MTSRELTAVSLFAASGIGDLALNAAGATVLVANELLPDRAELFRTNFPETEVIIGDIRENIQIIIDTTKRKLEGRTLDILFATPPCQGMSKNGRGKLLRGIRDGLKDAIDPRNQLATFVPQIANSLKPSVLIFENVPEMESTLVENSGGQLVDLLEHLKSLLPDYEGVWKTIEFADFGVPQRRQRLITIFVQKDVAYKRDLNGKLMSIYPEKTHASKPTGSLKPWVILEPRKYFWVSNTKTAQSAFDNQCISPSCLFEENPTHTSVRNAAGINSASTLTPILCQKCGDLLPRPVVEEDGQLRLMKGFTSAYKRMRGDLPSSALTTNLSYVMSDQKVHPTQHRSLSLLEAMMLHTITDFEWKWELSNGKVASDKLIRESIGESIPPRGLLLIFQSVFRKLFFNVRSENGIIAIAD